MKKLLMVASLLIWASTASAGQLENIYADIDAKMMSGNVNVLNYYSPSAVIITNSGSVLNLTDARNMMMQVIRAGGKIDVAQSEIIGTREIRTGIMQNLMGVVVFSQDYAKFSKPDPKDSNKRISQETSALTTRVFDISSGNYLIISEQSSEVR